MNTTQSNRWSRAMAAGVVGAALLLAGCTAAATPKQSASPLGRGSTKPQKQAESKSWFGSLFQPEEPKKPKTVKEWMDSGERPKF